MNQPELSDPCDCCDEGESPTPAAVDNRPGLAALLYRIGTHGRFKQAMLRGISRRRALDSLSTREGDDFSIALLDGWATVLDVLTFYQERIINEAYLRTATERFSLLELAQMIGYKLKPGAAATTYFAFDVGGLPGESGAALIPTGTKVQSLPLPGEKPQIFESVEDIEGRAVWNELQPQQNATLLPQPNATSAAFQGAALNLLPGDLLVFVRQGASASWDYRRILTAIVPSGADYTVVTWKDALTYANSTTLTAQFPYEAYVMRQRAAIFGATAPAWYSLPQSLRDTLDDVITPAPPSPLTDYPFFTIYAPSTTDTIDLDREYPQIVTDSLMLLVEGTKRGLFRITNVQDTARAAFMLSNRVTRVTLTSAAELTQFSSSVRSLAVYAQSQQLTFASVPLTTNIPATDTIILETAIEPPPVGRRMIISGTQAGTANRIAQTLTLKDVGTDADGRMTLQFEYPLAASYVRSDTILYGNVAKATHGETKSEVLGDGSGSVPFQSMTLRSSPLTYVVASDGSLDSTLDIYVNNVLWQEVPTLYGYAPDEHIYVIHLSDDQQTTIQFGDGITGARLPTGRDNVRAAYRVGSGLDGLVEVGQLNLLLTRPLGVQSVRNPLAPTGADDAESREDARLNAPLTVVTLDRVVSLEDFQYFARAFPGIDKARADWVWKSGRQVIHLTVAGAAGASVGTDLLHSLSSALVKAGAVRQPFFIASYTRFSFSLAARVLVNPAYIQEDVIAAVTAALATAFSFESRDFGQDVVSSEIMAVIQAVEGVVAVDVETLNGLSPLANPRVAASIATLDPANAANVLPAELLTIDLSTLSLTPVTSLTT